ncbi:MAG: 50S ribosomal protein L23 [Patescibacteria group bacterium]
MKLDKVLLKPIITEKSAVFAKDAVFTFEVALRATKNAIKESTKKLFNVTPLKVKTVIVPGRMKRIPGMRKFIKTSKWKKAFIALKKGQSISLFEIGEKK